MKVYGVGAYDVSRIVEAVSREKYDGNVVLKSAGDCGNRKGARSVFVLSVIDTGAEARGTVGNPFRAGTGPHGMRRKPLTACWHAHWDVIAAVFERFPDARITGGMLPMLGKGVDYRAGTWMDTALRTAELNLAGGRSGEHVTLPDCCTCDHSAYVEQAEASEEDPEWVIGSRYDAAGMVARRGGLVEPYRRDPDIPDSGLVDLASDELRGVPRSGYPLDEVPPAAPWVPPRRRERQGDAPGMDSAEALALIDRVIADGIG